MLIVQRRRAAAYDPDAQAYITAVEAADTQSLEIGVKDAINAFVVGCKADGIWSAIKASCIMAGARTLAGALVPLVGTAPTNFGFVVGDYNRKTGLVGDGNTKNLDSNRLCSSDEQNNVHGAVYVSTRDTAAGRYLSGTTFPAVPATGTFAIVGNTTGFRARVQATHGEMVAIRALNPLLVLECLQGIILSSPITLETMIPTPASPSTASAEPSISPCSTPA
jgi:hypothetical protein